MKFKLYVTMKKSSTVMPILTWLVYIQMKTRT